MCMHFGKDFRADTGFIPQVGVNEIFGNAGWTLRPKGFVSRLRTFINVDHQADLEGGLINRRVEPGLGMDTRLSGFMQYRYIDERILAGDRTLRRRRFGYIVQFSPSPMVQQVSVHGSSGEDIDFANSRLGHGTLINLSATLHPTSHLELALVQNQRWLNVDSAAGAGRRLFTARVSRIKSTYTFTARSYARVIAQYVSTNRDQALYARHVAPRDGTFSGTALFAYKVNWQSVLFIGYGDDRELSDVDQLEKADRQFFVKVSYAFQR